MLSKTSGVSSWKKEEGGRKMGVQDKRRNLLKWNKHHERIIEFLLQCDPPLGSRCNITFTSTPKFPTCRRLPRVDRGQSSHQISNCQPKPSHRSCRDNQKRHWVRSPWTWSCSTWHSWDQQGSVAYSLWAIGPPFKLTCSRPITSSIRGRGCTSTSIRCRGWWHWTSTSCAPYTRRGRASGRRGTSGSRRGWGHVGGAGLSAHWWSSWWGWRGSRASRRCQW